jgi:4-diphosphocytidyl-2-C-methyl-D-erythritol kinase
VSHLGARDHPLDIAHGGGIIRELARAKVNLTLEVLGGRADGYHELRSLVAFADLGDWLELAPGNDTAFHCTGSTAAAIDGPNLVERALAVASEVAPGHPTGRITLTKEIPVAAGLGGGSADAAACLRALARLWQDSAAGARLMARGEAIGADVPVCIVSRLSWMRGHGERVEALSGNLALPAVLANPGVRLSTREVFSELGALPFRADEPPTGTAGVLLRPNSEAELLDFVVSSRNDLEIPALRLCPAIADVLDGLRSLGGCRFARLSGSGPSCLGIFESQLAAERGASALVTAHPHWWVKSTVLG